MSTVAILWMRRDLRLSDNPALMAAAAADRLVPVFCLDPRLLEGRHRSGSRTQFMLDCLHDVDSSLRELGSRVVIRHGAPELELPALAVDVGAATVHAASDVGPYARRRDMAVTSALAARGVDLVLHPGVFVVDDPAEIRTGDGGPYTVFTPYHRSWERAPRREPLPKPRSLPGLPSGIEAGRIPALKALGLSQPLAEPPSGGERAGRARLDAFMADGVDSYHEQRNTLGHDGTSALSPYLHFGCLSPREAEHRLPDSAGAAGFAASFAGATSTPRSCAARRETPVPSTKRDTAGCSGAARDATSTPGARAAPATRSSTPRCASCFARGGSTIAAA